MKRLKKGLTLAEVMLASIISIIVLAGVYMLTYIVNSSWKSERAKSYITGQLEMAMERIQKELRATDINRIFYYPAGAASHNAISFPLAVDDDGNGFIELDASNQIIWDQTVIYHLYTNAQGKVELRRTLFSPRTTLTDAQRQQQLDDVVENGRPVASTPEYGNWNSSTGTKTLCENDNITLTITPTQKRFDAYASATSRSENVTFGSIGLAPGDHYITFTVEDKNASSSGYRLGVDSFCISPSGCSREAEEATVYEDTGASKVNEDMSGWGSWSGNRQLEYQATAVDDYIELSFYYDQWIETNFATSLPSFAVLEYDNKTGDDREETGNNDYVIRLGGCGDSWSAAAQTGAASKSLETVTVTSADGVCFRNVIFSKDIDTEGRAAKITFDNTQGSSAITVDYADIMTRTDDADGDSATRKNITFYDAGGTTSIAIPAGSSADSDWVDINNFDRSKDYLLTFHIPLSGDKAMTCWTTSDTLDDHSYILEGPAATAQDATWSDDGPTARDVVYAIDSADASFFSYGTVTSQIYDTGMSDPSYSTLNWTLSKNNYQDYAAGGLGANLVIRVRSDDNKEALKASTDWSSALSVNTLSQVTGTADISGTGNGRYVQFQGEFFSQPTSGKSDYLKSCVLKNVSIKWPGADRIVDISGYFTRRPNYGIFSVDIDGHALTKGLEIRMDITGAVAPSKTVTRSLTVEAEPRNTGR
jgi:Tfp pilus assembly protein PilV